MFVAVWDSIPGPKSVYQYVILRPSRDESHNGARKTITAGPYHNLIPYAP